MSKNQPKIIILSDEAINLTHEYTLKTLSTVGLRIDSKRARDCLVKGGCRFQEPDRILFDPDLVEWAIAAAPGTIDIYHRTGEHAYTLGNAKNTQTRFGIGATCLWYEDPKTTKIEAFTREHFALSTQLGNTLDNFDMISYPGILKEFADNEIDLRTTLENAANTTKPICIINLQYAQYRNTLDMLEHIHGNLSDRPFVVPYFNSVTPLIFDSDNTDSMFTTIEYGLPFILSNYGMSGASTPITAGGTLVAMNAELLGGLVLSQLIKEGTPIILGNLPSVFHMKRMVTDYTPQTMLVNLAGAEMMSHYDIPHIGTSGSGPGWGPDLTAAGVHWMNHLTSCIGKVSIAPDVGANLDSLVFSPATAVYANEVIRQSRLFAEGFVVDDSTVSIDEIAEVGPGGGYLISEKTMMLYRELEKEHSRIWASYALDGWQEQGCPSGHDVLIEYVCDIMDNLDIPEDQEAMIEKGNAFIEKLKLS